MCLCDIVTYMLCLRFSFSACMRPPVTSATVFCLSRRGSEVYRRPRWLSWLPCNVTSRWQSCSLCWHSEFLWSTSPHLKYFMLPECGKKINEMSMNCAWLLKYIKACLCRDWTCCSLASLDPRRIVLSPLANLLKQLSSFWMGLFGMKGRTPNTVMRMYGRNKGHAAKNSQFNTRPLSTSKFIKCLSQTNTTTALFIQETYVIFSCPFCSPTARRTCSTVYLESATTLHHVWLAAQTKPQKRGTPWLTINPTN